jgi:hypothetical protein
LRKSRRNLRSSGPLRAAPRPPAVGRGGLMTQSPGAPTHIKTSEEPADTSIIGEPAAAAPRTEAAGVDGAAVDSIGVGEKDFAPTKPLSDY